jgi:hypothetical protein
MKRRGKPYFIANEDGIGLELPLRNGGTELVYLLRYKEKRLVVDADHPAVGERKLHRVSGLPTLYKNLLDFRHLLVAVLQKARNSSSKLNGILLPSRKRGDPKAPGRRRANGVLCGWPCQSPCQFPQSTTDGRRLPTAQRTA